MLRMLPAVRAILLQFDPDRIVLLIFRRPRPALQWLIPSYLPVPSLVVLQGEAKAGKSFLAFQVACAVAGGTPFLRQPIPPQPVLYLQFDTSETVWRERLKNMRASVSIPRNLFFLHPDDQPTSVNILSPVTYH